MGLLANGSEGKLPKKVPHKKKKFRDDFDFEQDEEESNNNRSSIFNIDGSLQEDSLA